MFAEASKDTATNNADLPMVYEYFRDSSGNNGGLTAEADGFKYVEFTKFGLISLYEGY